MSTPDKNTVLVKNHAAALGFSFCGISKAEFLEEDAPRLENWLKHNRQGKMHYMENYFDKRLDPTKLVPGAKSVVSLMYNYYPKEIQPDDSYKVSKYAYGQDYHHVIKTKLKELVNYISEEIGEIDARVFVDSAPVLERSWAQRGGLGWIGKNSMLINPKKGSFYFLAEIILDLELSYDNAIKDYCGTCTACIDACPTDAILDDNVVDGSKCISYFTIELKDEIIPSSEKGKFEDWMFGCDICQDVCPWNRFAEPHQESLFHPHAQLLSKDKKEWVELTEEIYREIFKKSAVKRAKYSGLMRNIQFLKS